MLICHCCEVTGAETHHVKMLNSIRKKLKSSGTQSENALFSRKPIGIKIIALEDMLDVPISIAYYYFDGNDYLIVGLDRGNVQMYNISGTTTLKNVEHHKSLPCIKKVF